MKITIKSLAVLFAAMLFTACEQDDVEPAASAEVAAPATVEVISVTPSKPHRDDTTKPVFNPNEF